MADTLNKQVKIYIDNTAAEFALESLQTKAKGFTDAIQRARDKQAELNQKIAEANAAGKDISKLQTSYNELGNKINGTTKSLNENAIAQKKLQDQIDSGIRPTMAQMERQVMSLRNQLRNMSEDVPGYAAKFDSFKKAEAQLNSMKATFNGVAIAQRGWMDEAKTIAFGIVIGHTVEKAIMSITSYLGGMLSGSAKMSDSISQLKIYMHSTTEEAQKLYSSLKQIDTRTANSDLLDIATLVAKKGVAKEQIAGVTQALDQLFVVLGKEVGDPHEAVASLVKLVNVYSEDHHVTAENIGNIGAAIAKLTSSGVATGSFLINFAERMAGVRGITGITIQSVLGMGAALEELGQKSESASTAAQKMMMQMFLKPQVYAKAAGVEVSKFSEMLAKDPVEALIKVAGALKQGAKAPAELIAAFDEMGISGARVLGVMGDIAGNADYMRKRLNDSQKAFGDTGFLMDAFKEKNTNLAAEMDKLGKVFNSLVASPTLGAFFKNGVELLLGFINALKAAPKWMKENETAVYLFAAGIATMNGLLIKSAASKAWDTVVTIENIVVTKAKAIATNIAIAVESAYIVVTNLVSGSISNATAQTRLWTIATNMGLGPIGILILLIGVAVVAAKEYADSLNRITAAQRVHNEISEKVSTAIQDEQEKTRQLVAVINDHNGSLDNRNKALKALIDLNPQILNGLTLENAATEDGTKKIKAYIQSLRDKAEIEAKQSLLQDKLKQKQELLTNVRKQSPITANMNDDDITSAIFTPMSDSDKGEARTKKIETKGVIRNQVDKKVLDNLKEITQDVTFLQNAMDKIAEKDVTKIIGDVKKTAEDTGGIIANLKAQIDKLQTDLPGLKTRKEISQNIAETKKLQDELDALMGKTRKTHQDEIIKELEAFKQKLLGIGKQADERQIDQINFQYAQLAKKAAGHAKELIEIEALKSKAIAFLLEEEYKKQKELSENQITVTYKKNIEEAIYLGQDHKDNKAQEYAKGLIDKKTYEASVRGIEMETLQYQLKLAKIFSTHSKEAEADVLKYKKLIKQEEIKDAIKTREEIDAFNKSSDALRLETEKKIIDLKLGLVQKGSEEELKLQKEKLKKEYDEDIKSLNKKKEEHPELSSEISIEIDLRGKKFNSDSKSLGDNHDKEKIQKELEYASRTINLAQTVSNAISKIEDQAFNKWLKQKDKEKHVIEQNAKNRLITGVEAERQQAAIQLESDKKKQELELKQFERNKAISIASAFINGAHAITADQKVGLPLSAFLIGLDIATTAAQIAEMSSSSPKFAKGAAIDGPSHSEGGLPIINPRTGTKVAEIEGGEYILSRNTVNNNRAIADMLLHSSMNNNGARVNLPWQTRQYQTLDIPSIRTATQNLKFASGGIMPTLNNVPTNDKLLPPIQVHNQVVVQHDDETKGLMAAMIHHLQNPVVPTVNVPLTKIDDAYTARTRIQKNAGA